MKAYTSTVNNTIHNGKEEGEKITRWGASDGLSKTNQSCHKQKKQNTETKALHDANFTTN